MDTVFMKDSLKIKYNGQSLKINIRGLIKQGLISGDSSNKDEYQGTNIRGLINKDKYQGTNIRGLINKGLITRD
jgi:hypothetical protein